MGKVLTHVSLATLLAAGALAYLAKPASSRVEALDAGYSRGLVVADRDGYFVVTLGEVALIFAADSSSG